MTTASPSCCRIVRQQVLIHAHVGNAEVARQQLHVRQGVTLTGCHNACNRWQVGNGLRQQVDAVS